MNAFLLSAFWGIFFMLGGAFANQKGKAYIVHVVILACFTLIGANLLEQMGIDWSCFIIDRIEVDNWLLIDTHFLDIQCVSLVAMILYFATMGSHISRESYAYEIIAVLFFSLIGMYLMLSFKNLLIVFLGIEIFSLPLFILAGSRKYVFASVEAALKYFVLGAFFSAILLFGITLTYGYTGSFSLTYHSLNSLSGHPMLLIFGFLMMMIALLFKTGIAPFHYWVADVYEGTPTHLVSYLGGVSKIASFMLLHRIFSIYGADMMRQNSFWWYFISVLIILSLTIANFLAIKQRSVKRMLAYSGIAQGAFMLFALYDTADATSYQGILIFTFGYALALIAIFAILSNEPDDAPLQGLLVRSPLKAFLASVALLSLSGLPGTIGFLGKFYMLRVGIMYGNLVTVITAVIFSAISLYYYLGLIKKMYFSTLPANSNSIQEPLSFLEKVVYLSLIACMIILGFICF